MQKVFVLHGICDAEEYYSPDHPSPSNHHWIPWIQKQLMMKGYDCQTPEVPKSYEGKWEDWESTIDSLPIDDNTILIGHSAGCGAFLKYLSLNPSIKMERLIMVAPFIDPEKSYGDFLQCDLADNLESRVKDIYIVKSDDEPLEAVSITTAHLNKVIHNAKYSEVQGYGHCVLDAMGGQNFLSY